MRQLSKGQISQELMNIVEMIECQPDLELSEIYVEIDNLKSDLERQPRDLKDGSCFHVTVPKSFRWLPYEEKSNEFKKGKLGRFQERSVYAGDTWRNTLISEEILASYYKMETLR